MSNAKYPYQETKKINTRQAVEHVVKLLCSSEPGYGEFAKNLLGFLPEGSLTEAEDRAIREEYDLED